MFSTERIEFVKTFYVEKKNPYVLQLISLTFCSGVYILCIRSWYIMSDQKNF